MFLELKVQLSAWRDDFLTGYEQRRRFITAFEGKVPDGRLVGREANHELRQGLVRASADHPVAMAYGSAPPIMFRPFRGGIHMVAFGSEASEVLETHSPIIKKQLSAFFGRLDKSTLETGNMAARSAETLIPYECGAMAVKKLDHRGQHVIGQTYTLHEMRVEIGRSIAGGVISRSQGLREDTPELDGTIPSRLEDQVAVLGGTVLVGRPGGPDGPLCIVVHKLRFALPITLFGYWEGGHYRSYGYGTFMRSRPPALSDARPRRAA